jgi:hypothetical protein
VSIKDTRFYAAFRRVRDRFKAKLRRFRRKVDAATGGRGLRDAALSSLVANDTAVLKALVYLVERAQEEEIRRRAEHEDLLQRLAAMEAALREMQGRLEALGDAAALPERALPAGGDGPRRASESDAPPLPDTRIVR